MRRIVAIVLIVILVTNSNVLAASNNKQITAIFNSNIIDGAMSEPVSKVIILKFNKTIQKGAGFSKISLLDGKKNVVAISMAINKNTLSISHKANLEYFTYYTLVIPQNAIKCIGGLLSKDMIFRFRTINKSLPAPTQKPTPLPTVTPSPIPTPTPTPVPNPTITPVLDPTPAAISVPCSKELHAFYPAYISYNSDTEQFINKLDSISFAWGRLEFNEGAVINTTRGRNGNFGFYIPNDSVYVLKNVKSKGISAQLSIYSKGSDLQKILPFKDIRDDVINKVINLLSEGMELGEGQKFFYDGVVMDFEDMHDTDKDGNKILQNGEVISTYYNIFLQDLKERLNSINKRLIVALQPITFNDGYEYDDIILLADKVIIMAHDYAPRTNISKSDIMKYVNSDIKKQQIYTLAPVTEVNKVLKYVMSKTSNSLDLSKIWVQISFDSRQWGFKLQNSNEWECLESNTLSTECLTPKYSTISKYIENTDAVYTDFKFNYIKSLESPYMTFYNSQKGLFEFVLYEDSNSVKAKVEKAQAYKAGGISIWAIGNIPNYDGVHVTDYNLDVWQQILKLLNK